ncbi:MAG TPA: glycosyltransferase [Blastocatellia bacterium]|nr:glycosyltransferase [Blastocatellia bacterium]
MLKVHILYEHSNDLRPHGSGYIRLLRPLTHPTIEGAFQLSWGLEYEPAEVVIIERTVKPSMTLRLAEQYVKRARADRSRLIYTIDDNLLDLRVQGPVRYAFTTEEMMVVRYLAREADGLIVSTGPLKERMSRFNDRIEVVPNALDERLVSSRPSGENESRGGNGRKLIGFMGTLTHDSDLMMVLQAVRETLRKHKDEVEFQLVGGIADQAVLDLFDGLPVRQLDVGDNVEYPAFMKWMSENVWWDLAIAPLEDTPFTRCKSDIKFLDYSIIGIPGIYSRVPPYEKTVRHMETGYLVANDNKDWLEALELLLTVDSLRKDLGRRSQHYVLSSRTLEHCASNWRDAILSLVNDRNKYAPK